MDWRDARNPDASHRFYPPFEHPATYRVREQLKRLWVGFSITMGGMATSSNEAVGFLGFAPSIPTVYELGHRNERKRAAADTCRSAEAQAEAVLAAEDRTGDEPCSVVEGCPKSGGLFSCFDAERAR